MGLNEIVLVGVALGAGFTVQSILRWRPVWNVWVTFLLILILPPAWSIGLSAGLWLACAFITYRPILGYQNEVPRSWVWILADAFFTFSGFILTLLLLWKVKSHSGLPLILRHEVGSWLYFITIEICFFRIVALNYPFRKRFAVGYGIGFYDTLLVLYWIYSYGWKVVALTFITLLVISPLLLLWLDRPARPTNGIPLGGDL